MSLVSKILPIVSNKLFTALNSLNLLYFFILAESLGLRLELTKILILSSSLFLIRSSEFPDDIYFVISIINLNSNIPFSDDQVSLIPNILWIFRNR